MSDGTTGTTNSAQDIAALRLVMAIMEDRLDEVVDAVPSPSRDLISNALLNIAVEWMLAGAGTAVTVSVLRRLTELVSCGRRPPGDGAISLSRPDA
jgi:hypothetical protein